MIRLILICLWILFIFVPFGIPALLITLLVGLFSKKLQDRLTMGYVKLVTRGITFLAGEKIVVIGRENVPKSGSFLVVSNHRSFFDIFTAYRFLPNPCACVSKKEWKKLPLLNFWMMLLHCYFLDRKSPRDGLRCSMAVADELRAGRSFWICPEGTRSHKDTLLPFKEGSFRAAFQTGKAILPMTLTHTDDLFEKHLPWVRSGTVTVCFSKPVPTEGLDKAGQKALVQAVQDQIQKAYNEYV